MSNQIQKQAEIENEQQQQAMTELKLVEQQPLMNQFPFFGDDLQLGTLPFHTHTYRLQPTHPNLQDQGNIHFVIFPTNFFIQIYFISTNVCVCTYIYMHSDVHFVFRGCCRMIVLRGMDSNEDGNVGVIYLQNL